MSEYDDKPVFAQIYFYDTDLDKQLQRRQEIFTQLNPNMLRELQDELHEINPFVHTFMSAGDQAKDNANISDMNLFIHNTHGKDMRQYNKPIASEIAVIIFDYDYASEPRDIIIKTHEEQLQHISELHSAYDPLQYPLLFPYSEYGWHDNILRINISEPEPEPDSESEDLMEIEDEFRHTGATQDMENLLIEPKKSKGKHKAIEIESDDNDDDDNDDDNNNDNNSESLEFQQIIKKRKYVTIKKFVVYQIQIRNSNKTKSILHLSGRLFQQYLVDQYAKWESNHLRWYRNNQQNLRIEIYSGLQDIVSDEDAIIDKIGKISSSFTGSTRYMQQLYQDSMAIIREYEKSDLFVTVTCNPNWPKITNELLPNQQASDCSDLISRVFKLKLKSITNDLFVKDVLGKVIAHVHVIEFQKRGLPHAHILMILSPEDKPKTPEDFDKLVCAKISDRNLQPKLYETISKNMIHGPCGYLNPNSPCMIDGKCSKHYHREFIVI